MKLCKKTLEKGCDFSEPNSHIYIRDLKRIQSNESQSATKLAKWWLLKNAGRKTKSWEGGKFELPNRAQDSLRVLQLAGLLCQRANVTIRSFVLLLLNQHLHICGSKPNNLPTISLSGITFPAVSPADSSIAN